MFIFAELKVIGRVSVRMNAIEGGIRLPHFLPIGVLLRIIIKKTKTRKKQRGIFVKIVIFVKITRRQD